MTTHPYLTYELARERGDAWQTAAKERRFCQAEPSNALTAGSPAPDHRSPLAAVIAIISPRGAVRLSRAAR